MKPWEGASTKWEQKTREEILSDIEGVIEDMKTQAHISDSIRLCPFYIDDQWILIAPPYTSDSIIRDLRERNTLPVWESAIYGHNFIITKPPEEIGIELSLEGIGFNLV